MNRLVTLALLAATAALSAAPVPTTTPDTVVSDPAKFLPTRAYTARDGAVVGVLVADAVKVMGRDGRSSQADAIAFSRDGGSYNWLYVPVDDAPQISNLQVRVGPKGDMTVVYPKLSMASPKTTKGWGVDARFALVEVTVNDGKGAPADEAFVASGVKVVEGTKAYPLKAADCVAAARTAFTKHTEANAKDLDAALDASRKAAVGDHNATGPVLEDELLHVSWLPDDARLAVTFLAGRSDGVWQTITLGPSPADPNRNREETVGTGFGIRYGRRYLFDAKGKLVETVTLAPAAYKFAKSPPSAAPPRGIDPPLPPPVKK